MDVLGVLLTVLSIGVAALALWLTLRQRTRRGRLIGLAVLAIWLALSVPIAWTFDSPYVSYELAVNQCGHQPVIATNFAAGYTYDLPGDAGYGPSIFNNTYYCTAAEAEAAGYRRGAH